MALADEGCLQLELFGSIEMMMMMMMKMMMDPAQ